MLNGIDMQEWNPEADRKIYQTYSAANLKEGKTANKLALQKELSLAERPDVRLQCILTQHSSKSYQYPSVIHHLANDTHRAAMHHRQALQSYPEQSRSAQGFQAVA